MFKKSIISILIVICAYGLQANPIEGIQQPNTLNFTIKPITISLPQIDMQAFKGGQLQVRVESIDPEGRKYHVKDESGQGQWAVETVMVGNALQIRPDISSYAGPVQILINDKVVDRYSRLIPGSRELVLEKIISTRLNSGAELNVHFTDFSLEKIEDKTYPYRVLQHMRRAYEILNRKLHVEQEGGPKDIHVYLGDTDETGLYPFGGFDINDFKRAPLFVIRTDNETGTKSPAILLPMDYRKFLEFWNQINRVPKAISYSEDDYLATSIIHEMTHALIHDVNENLGSTEHQIQNGDWFTEGVARYFETKVETDPGFASMGFRQKLEDKIRFSRGGANYWLRYPDESFFKLRYEAALFWMFLEKEYGEELIHKLSHRLHDFPFDATAEMYMDVMRTVVGIRFEDLLHHYHEWVYLKKYRKYSEGRNLEEVAKTKTIWQNGMFNLLTGSGDVIARNRNLSTDWISKWADFGTQAESDYVAGDLTKSADLNALTADFHEILVQKDRQAPVEVTVYNGGKSRELKISFFMETEDGQTRIEHTVGRNGKAVVKTIPLHVISKVGLVISNLDPNEMTTYSIEIK